MMLLVMVGRTWCAGGREGGQVGGRTAAGVIINTLFIWAHPKTAKENLSRLDLFTKLFTLCPGPVVAYLRCAGQQQLNVMTPTQWTHRER